MKTIIVIPARWDSSRFKGKPLVLIKGVTMLERVWEKAKLSKEADDVIIATDNKKIQDFCKKNEFKVIMTSKSHKTGTDRISEVSRKVNANIYVNLQGDEPLINPKSIDTVIKCLKKNIKNGFDVSTGYTLLNNNYKDEKKATGYLVKSKYNEVLFVSRLPIPLNIKEKKIKRLKHVGLYAFTKRIIQEFSKLKIGQLEKNESIELLRFLENKKRVICTLLKNNINQAVDHASDIKKVEKYLKK